MNWQVTIVRGPVPPIPDSLIKDIAALLMAQCEHEHTIWCRVTCRVGGEPDYTEKEYCSFCGKEMHPAMIEPVDIDQLADSQI